MIQAPYIVLHIILTFSQPIEVKIRANQIDSIYRTTGPGRCVVQLKPERYVRTVEDCDQIKKEIENVLNK